jgi:hypothetical protein
LLKFLSPASSESGIIYSQTSALTIFCDQGALLSKADQSKSKEYSMNPVLLTAARRAISRAKTKKQSAVYVVVQHRPATKIVKKARHHPDHSPQPKKSSGDQTHTPDDDFD